MPVLAAGADALRPGRTPVAPHEAPRRSAVASSITSAVVCSLYHLHSALRLIKSTSLRGRRSITLRYAEHDLHHGLARGKHMAGLMRRRIETDPEGLVRGKESGSPERVWGGGWPPPHKKINFSL